MQALKPNEIRLIMRPSPLQKSRSVTIKNPFYEATQRGSVIISPQGEPLDSVVPKTIKAHLVAQVGFLPPPSRLLNTSAASSPGKDLPELWTMSFTDPWKNKLLEVIPANDIVSIPLDLQAAWDDKDYIPLTKEQITTLAQNLIQSRSFHSSALHGQAVSISNIFLPIRFADDAYKRWIADNHIVAFYAPMDQASQTGISGLPIFNTAIALNKDDNEKLLNKLKAFEAVLELC